MENENKFSHDSSAVMKHLEFLQGIISRMAGNSASCKTWTIAVVTAVLTLLHKSGFSIFLAFIPVLFFLILDSMYLGLEKHYRILHEQFVDKLNKGELKKKDIYDFGSKAELSKCVKDGAKSFSTWVFYALIALVILILFFTPVVTKDNQKADIEQQVACDLDNNENVARFQLTSNISAPGGDKLILEQVVRRGDSVIKGWVEDAVANRRL